MTEQELRDKWNSEKPVYDAWGGFVVRAIVERLKERGVNPEVFLKTPASHRLKDDASLVDKAFYRQGKAYEDPYNEIEDKVGARFVVLLIDDIQIVCDLIESSGDWVFDACRNFKEEREENPLLFTYQSVHYIVRPSDDFTVDGLIIPQNTPCEIQIRTLLQHAHAELTHDAIYKSKTKIKPVVHRTVAKSMALIETTDDFFKEVAQRISLGPLQDHNIEQLLTGVYKSVVRLHPRSLKSSLAIWDTYEAFIDGELIDKITSVVDENPGVVSAIREKYARHAIYQQVVVLFLYWMLLKKRRRLMADWPLDRRILEMLANDLGVSLDPE